MKKRTYPRPCTRCGTVLPEDGFYVKYKDTGARFSQCKECHNAHTRAALKREHDADPEAFNAKRRARVAAKPEQYREGQRRARARNPELYRETQRKWKERNPEKVKEAERRGREAKRQYQAARPGFRESIQQRYREKNREQLRAAGRQRYQQKPEIFKVNLALRRARERQAPGVFTAAEWLALCAKYGNRCLCCGATNMPLTPDHIVPLARGGSNDIGNIQPLCRRCNSAKNAKTIDYRPLCNR